jgi:hypothetical protein
MDIHFAVLKVYTIAKMESEIAQVNPSSMNLLDQSSVSEVPNKLGH